MSTLTQTAVEGADGHGYNVECVDVVRARLRLHMSPRFMGRVRDAVVAELAAQTMKYHPGLGGVLLAFGNITIPHTHGRIINDESAVHFVANFSAVVFAPRPGMLLVGECHGVGPDHIAMLVRALPVPPIGIPNTLRVCLSLCLCN